MWSGCLGVRGSGYYDFGPFWVNCNQSSMIWMRKRLHGMHACGWVGVCIV